MDDIDVYGIARLYISEYGYEALNILEKEISYNISINNNRTASGLYDIKEAIKDMQKDMASSEALSS
ncbi:hypothetical protein N9W34_06575 [Rickettsiales bacterium]|nr:hypothetical protein [Rickettsiales bacterium]